MIAADLENMGYTYIGCTMNGAGVFEIKPNFLNITIHRIAMINKSNRVTIRKIDLNGDIDIIFDKEVESLSDLKDIINDHNITEQSLKNIGLIKVAQDRSGFSSDWVSSKFPKNVDINLQHLSKRNYSNKYKVTCVDENLLPNILEEGTVDTISELVKIIAKYENNV